MYRALNNMEEYKQAFKEKDSMNVYADSLPNADCVLDESEQFILEDCNENDEQVDLFPADEVTEHRYPMPRPDQWRPSDQIGYQDILTVAIDPNNMQIYPRLGLSITAPSNSEVGASAAGAASEMYGATLRVNSCGQLHPSMLSREGRGRCVCEICDAEGRAARSMQQSFTNADIFARDSGDETDCLDEYEYEQELSTSHAGQMGDILSIPARNLYEGNATVNAEQAYYSHASIPTISINADVANNVN